MQNTEGGRKLNQAMMNTGRAVAHTGKAVGESSSIDKQSFRVVFQKLNHKFVGDILKCCWNHI
jgi:hypothetical protein